MSRLTVVLAALLLGCGSEGTSRPDEAMELTLERLGEGHTVRPVEGWTVSGLRLVSVERDGPNPLERRWVVGVDEVSGEVVRGPELMARLPEAHPATLAARALSILVERHGSLPLRSGDERDAAIPEAQWALISAPSQSPSELVFWALVEQFERTLIEYRVRTRDWSLDWREAAEVLAAEGAIEDSGPSFCDAVARCGCFSGCERVQPVVDPRHPDQVIFRALDANRGQRLVRGECVESSCSRVCVAPPGATCVGALVPMEPQACTVSCPPSIAPFHCETSADACRRIEHERTARPEAAGEP